MSQSSQVTDATEQQVDDMDSVNARIRESLSALMDGEAEELELRRILSAEHSELVNERWQSYHMVRSAMHNDGEGLAFRHLDISQQVAAAIAEEQPLKVGNSRTWLRPVAGFAVAASVAVAVVVGVQDMGQVQPGVAAPAEGIPAVASSRVYPVAGSSLQAAAGSAPETVVTYHNTQLPGAIAVSQAAAEKEADKSLEKYFLRHTENAALNNGQGMMPFARVVSFESE